MTLTAVVRALCAGITLWGSTALYGQGEIQGSLPSPGNLPTEAPMGAHYLGRNACAQCHPAEAASQQSTPMANTLQPGADSQILQSHPQMRFQSGRFSYQIAREGNQFVYRVTDHKETISEPILWSFGLGRAGQTYVFQHKGIYYESRVSFYSEIPGLDFTVGAFHSDPASLEEAAGQQLSSFQARDCFGCHATAAFSESQLKIVRLTPGIDCEGCHHAGGKHVAAIQAGDIVDARKQIFNPGKLNAEQLSDFCGSCHGTLSRVIESRLRGISNVRYQPYRLSNSRCYSPDDRRISCVACHNPHQKVDRDPGSYDSHCLACHVTRSGRITAGEPAACPVATDQCVTCHMPKYEVPGSHFKFADHWIRVVKANESYPD